MRYSSLDTMTILNYLSFRIPGVRIGGREDSAFQSATLAHTPLDPAEIHREVVIKVLSEAFTLDYHRLSRFELESKVLSTSEHHSIGALCDIQEADGRRFLFMPLSDRETLADRVAKGPFPSKRLCP